LTFGKLLLSMSKQTLFTVFANSFFFPVLAHLELESDNSWRTWCLLRSSFRLSCLLHLSTFCMCLIFSLLHCCHSIQSKVEGLSRLDLVVWLGVCLIHYVLVLAVELRSLENLLLKLLLRRSWTWGCWVQLLFTGGI
jgi:hypothetical protein